MEADVNFFVLGVVIWTFSSLRLSIVLASLLKECKAAKVEEDINRSFLHQIVLYYA
jgi:hypothetical protein